MNEENLIPEMIDGDMVTQAVIQELRQMADGRYFATHRSTLQTAATTLEQISERLEEWHNTFPGKTPQEISLLLAAADFLVKANGKLMAENERLREQRPLTAEEKLWVEKAWQEYKASPPKWKDEITCMRCGFRVSRPIDGKWLSNCQNCGMSHGLEAFQ